MAYSPNNAKPDDGAFTVTSDKVTPIGGMLDNTSPDSVDEGDIGVVRMNANRALHVVVRDNAGNERGLNVDANGEIQISGTRNALPITDNSGSLTVDNAGTFAVQATVAASAANIAKAEDAASADADVGVPAMAVRKATPANTSGADGDYEMLQMSAGRLWTSTVVEASETHVGEIGTASDLIDITLSLDTSAYAAGDVMADTQTISNAVRVTSGRGVLQSILVLDEDAQAKSFDIIFFSANRSLGTENSAPNISDTNLRDILGFVKISSSDYITISGASVATKTGIGLHLEASGSRDLYVGTIIREAGTYTASGVRLRLGILWD